MFQSPEPITTSYSFKPAADSSFTVTDMFSALRAANNSNEVVANSSHVSTFTSTSVACHWFTATPNPSESVFKPFVFTENVRISPLTKIGTDAKETLLQNLHAQRNWDVVGDLLKSLEATCVEEVNTLLSSCNELPTQEFDELLKDCVEAEVKFYR